ncbi:MAG: Lipoprotein signal peptidase [Gammaproteobacteria bacterium]|nr:Lipoprotein signal peptidase [Gammaproteobacteria bacterium]
MLRKVFIRILLLGLIALPGVGCDQMTKALARDHLAGRPAISAFHDVFRLQYAENRGAFLSAGARLEETTRQRLLIGGSAALTGLVAVYLLFAPGLSVAAIAGLGLVIAGGIGNLVDRVANAGNVVDFLNVGLGQWRTGIFNFADLFLTIGVLVVLLADRHRPRTPD